MYVHGNQLLQTTDLRPQTTTYFKSFILPDHTCVHMKVLFVHGTNNVCPQDKVLSRGQIFVPWINTVCPGGKLVAVVAATAAVATWPSPSATAASGHRCQPSCRGRRQRWQAPPPTPSCMGPRREGAPLRKAVQR